MANGLRNLWRSLLSCSASSRRFLAGAMIAEAFCVHQCQTFPDCCPLSCGEVACCFGGVSCLDPNCGVCYGRTSILAALGHAAVATIRACLTASCCPAGQAVCNNARCQPAEARSIEGICCEQQWKPPQTAIPDIAECSTDLVSRTLGSPNPSTN